ncbi:hypothetical protein [Geobacillus kaustophilus]|uniref:hypothetical protein n=1 Tax=Geobacillus kaustophilus TaxID=1462 RepID=UPI0005CD10A6|nr:hypothetical protein [Geobacillus kaustophilus]
MSKEQKTTQLQQKIIHLKSELDKYKALLASLGSQEEWERLHMEKDELQAKHDELIEQCRRYKEMLSAQMNEMERLSEALKMMEEEKEWLRQETEQWKTKCAYWKEQAEANQTHIQSLDETLKAFQQDETLSFMNESTDSWASWLERLEKDYNAMKGQMDKISKDVSNLQNDLSNIPKIEALEKDIGVFTKQMQQIQDKLFKIEIERQKDSLTLQKHIFTQQMELELMMEKVTSFASEMKHLANQIADFTQSQNDSHHDANELKEMLSELMQRFTASSDERSKEPETSPTQSATPFSTSTQAGKAPSSPKGFLKLREFMDEANQPIIVSPVKRKETHSFNVPLSHLYSQKSVSLKRVRMEHPSSHHRHPSQLPSPPAEDEGNRLDISVQSDPPNREERSDALKLGQNTEQKLSTQAEEVRSENIHKAAEPSKNENEQLDHPNRKIKAEQNTLVPLDGQEALIQDPTSASGISADGQKSDFETYEVASSLPSASVLIQKDAILHAEDSLMEEGKRSKWGLWSLFKKMKTSQ